LFNGNIFNQEDEPTTQVQNDIWLNPQEPYSVKQFDGTDWQDFNDVILQDSKVTVSSGVITALEQPKYNNSHLIANKEYISGLGMPSDRYIDLTLGASGSTYTAPANGKYYLAKISGATGFRNIALSNVTAHYLVHDFSENTIGITLNANLEAKKGDIVRIDYTSTGSTIDFKFIYAEGEV
jgi:hypothetical protein